MMISGVFLLSMLTFVCSQSDMAAYVQSIDAIEGVSKQLEEQIISMEGDIPDITDFRRHYSILLTHLVRVANIIHTYLGAHYDDIFIRDMPDNIVVGLINVEHVINTTKDILKSLDERTRKVQSLIDTLCPGVAPFPDSCNQIVDQAVKGDPQRYEKEAHLILLAGDVAQELLKSNFISVAKAYDEEAYLIHHMSDLNTLVFGMVDILNHLSDE